MHVYQFDYTTLICKYKQIILQTIVHCIAFPMNGPVECLKKLPCLDEKYRPQATLLVPQDEWMKKAGKYKHLYKMDTEIAYDWLRVWVDAKHPSFQNCINDTSDSVRDGLNLITKKLLKK